jgi:hypothetical protein
MKEFSHTHIFSTLPSAEIRIHGICIYPSLVDQDNKRPESSGKFEWTEVHTLMGKARNNIKNLSAVFDPLSNNTSEEKFNFSFFATMASETKNIYFKWHKGRYGHKIIINITEDSWERILAKVILVLRASGGASEDLLADDQYGLIKSVQDPAASNGTITLGRESEVCT